MRARISMKKTSINALCVIIILILASNVLTTLWTGVQAFVSGYNAPNPSGELLTPVRVAMNHYRTASIAPSDTVYLDGGKTYAAMVDRATLMMPDHSFWIGAQIIDSVCIVAVIVLLVLLIIQFVKFIVNINRGLIFEYVNIRHLRRFGVYLLAISAVQCIMGLANDYAISRLGLSSCGVALVSAWTLPWSDMLFGCLALLMAQIWTRGLRMREEQELTI